MTNREQESGRGLKNLFMPALTEAGFRASVKRWFHLAAETIRFGLVKPAANHPFLVVSTERNAGEAAVKCLQSVYDQDYERELVRHFFIDDASTDGTDMLVETWLRSHPRNSVQYARNNKCTGGTCNNLKGFSSARAGEIVLELNGDDWLPDSKVLGFLNKVYQNPEVWMTYNTLRKFCNGRYDQAAGYMPFPREVIEKNSFRDYKWNSSHLHSFRSELFFNVQESSMRDPETGELWEMADDMALYLSMLELAGSRSMHVHRVTYIYNYCPVSNEERDRQKRIEMKIRAMPRYRPLDKLTLPAGDLGRKQKKAEPC